MPYLTASVSCKALSSPDLAQCVQELRWVKGYSAPQKTQRSVGAYRALRSPVPLWSIDLISARSSRAGISIPCQRPAYWLNCTFRTASALRKIRHADADNRVTHGIIPLEEGSR